MSERNQLHGMPMWVCPCLDGNAAIFAANPTDMLGLQRCPFCFKSVAESDAFPMWLTMLDPSETDEDRASFVEQVMNPQLVEQVEEEIEATAAYGIAQIERFLAELSL